MRAERIAPATWLLAAAAAWAVAGLALAWAGMGGRVGAANDGSVAAPPLPSPSAAAADLPPASYDAFAARPPFAQDRRPHPFSLPGGATDTHADASGFDYALSSVIITPRLRMAILEPVDGGEPVRVREGESAEGLGGWRLIELRPRAAVFEGAGGRRELDLRVWAGGDGSAASMLQAVPVPDAAPEPGAPAPQPGTRAPVDGGANAAGAGAGAASSQTQVKQQMDAIRQRIEARRAQLRREARQSQAATPPTDKPQAQPARNP